MKTFPDVRGLSNDEFIALVRRVEMKERAELLRDWRDCDMMHARDWREIARAYNCDLSADIRRNVRYAREWNWVLVRFKRRRKLQ